jgi:hypothetical protein
VTYAPPELLALAYRLEDACPTAVFSGIVGDVSHTYGFHCSARQLDWNRGDYSLADADNWAGAQADPDAAAALDISMGPADMRTVTGRLHISWADPTDDRLSSWYEFIGTVDSVNVGRWVCYPPMWGGPYTSDSSHLRHIHASCLRNHVHDQRAMDAMYSAWTGQTYQQWLQGGATDDSGGTTMDQNTVVTSARSGPASLAHVWLSTYDGVQLDLKPALQRLEQFATDETARDGVEASTLAEVDAAVDQLGTVLGELAARPPVQLTDAQAQQLAEQILAAYGTRLDAIEAGLSAIRGAMSAGASAQLAELGVPQP